MKILIDIGHPGHVHYFKNTIKYLKDNGHEIMVTARDREFVLQLLEKYNISYINRGQGQNSLIGKVFYMLKADYILYKASKKFKPDLFLSFASPYAAQVAFLKGKPHIALTDTEHVGIFYSLFTYPFTSHILTPESFLKDLGVKQIRFRHVVEGLYLHENYFQPNPQIRTDLGLKDNVEFVLLRFVSWNAHHDVGENGLDYKTKLKLVDILKRKYKVFISSEGELPDELKPYEIKISPEKIHHVLAEASLFVGESATMASESALLGTFAVFINSLPLMCNIKVGQEAGLIRHFQKTEGVEDFISSLMNNLDLKNESKRKAEELRKKHINPAAFLNWFIESYPESADVMKKTPEFQLRFN